MQKSHNPNMIRIPVILFVFVLAALSQIRAQPASASTEQRDRGIELLENGDAIGASNLLRAVTKKNQDDLVAWHWLGKALEQQRKSGDARKAYEIAARLGEDLVMKQMETGILPSATGTGSRLKPRLELALESADSFLRLDPSKSTSEDWIQRRDLLATYAGFPQVGGFPLYTGKELTSRARVLAKPEPSSTSEARQNRVRGKVVLRAIFGGDGKVHGIVAIKHLPYGLTLTSINAARQIKFIPATREGRPVSVWIQLEYNFHLN